MPTEVISKNWNVRHPNPELQVKFSNELGIHPIVSQIMINRGITGVDEAERFLNADLTKLYDPFLLKDMDVAVERIKKAQGGKETVLIFGDYDADGVTSSAILYGLLTGFGIKVVHYIPHRMKEGYGLNGNVLGYAKENNVSLLIAVDCGITAFEPVRLLKKEGIDVIVFDHHEPSGNKIPDAVAVVNPKRGDCSYPFRGLASAGLMAKLSQALLGRIPDEYLVLAAIGTITDVAELTGENRVFVKTGLKFIQKTKNIGLKALIDVAKIKGKKFKPYFIGFILGPRINATGRMDSAQISLELLISKEKDRAYELARLLEAFNAQRQRIQGTIFQEASSVIERDINFNHHKVIIVHGEGWHKGVVGIVASRIAEKYYRPTIVLSIEDGIATGSARSIEGFHLFDALSECAGHLDDFGGHKMAAGLTIQEKNLDAFKEDLNAIARQTMDVENLLPSLELDAEIPLSQLTLDLVSIVETLEPFGEGNRTPVFCSRKLTVKSPAVVLGKDTLKFWVSDGETAVQVVGFGMGKYRDMVNEEGVRVDLAYTLSIDDWNKDPMISLKLKDMRQSEE